MPAKKLGTMWGKTTCRKICQRLAPIERAVFLLREIFDYEYAEISSVVGQNEVNCRQILRRDPVEIEGVIAQAVKLKAEVVSADEHEGGLRRVLNLGHTIGHALEAETGYRSLPHGEAVAWGLIAATNIALTVGRTDSLTAGRIAEQFIHANIGGQGPARLIRVKNRQGDHDAASPR